MKLSEVRTLESIADYAEALANDIENGVQDKDGTPNGQLIADFAVHCAEIAIGMIEKKTHWNLLSEKSPVCAFPTKEGDFESEKILIKNTSGFIYEAIARRFPEQSNTSFLTAESKDFEDGDSFICEVYIDNVVEWMEIPKN